MKYLIVTGGNAQEISRELYKIAYPTRDNQTKYLFGWVEHEGQQALTIDENWLIKVDDNCDLATLINLLPNVSGQEKQQLKAYIDSKKGSSVRFGDIIPSTVEVRDTIDWFDE